MQIKSEYGVYANIDKQKTEYHTQKYSMEFYFSSYFNKKRFDEKLDEFVTTESIKLQSRYDFKIIADEMLALCLYKKIEKRGFAVYNLVRNKFIDKQKYFVLS